MQMITFAGSTQEQHLNTANISNAAIKQIHFLCCIICIPFSIAICSIIYYFILAFQLWNLNQIFQSAM